MASPIKPIDSVLLVTAHPDDECMFFAPLLNYLSNHLATPSRQVHILCATTGNAEGLGHIRRKELLEAVQHFMINPANVTMLDEPGFQDGPGLAWDFPKLCFIIREYVTNHNINYIITFDKNGVTRHSNHIEVYRAVQDFIAYTGAPKPAGFVAAYSLRTLHPMLNYCGSLMWMVLCLSWLLQHLTPVPYNMLPSTFTHFQPSHVQAYWAMDSHRSQFVWFRLLHILFSSYMWINTIDLIPGKIFDD